MRVSFLSLSLCAAISIFIAGEGAGTVWAQDLKPEPYLGYSDDDAARDMEKLAGIAPASGDHAGPAAPQPQHTLTPIEQEIAAQFDLWNKTLQTGTPKDMAKLYAEDGVLLPTVSNDVRENRAEIADYFVHFMALKPRGTINEQHIDVLDSNTAINAGIYTFDVIRDGKPDKVQARYSYVYEKENGVWLIKNHHSSKMPEPTTAAPVH